MSLGGSVASFALVAGLITIIPGLDTAMVLLSTIRHGRQHGFATALGVDCGMLIWGAGAAIGLTALLEVSTIAYTTIRIVGAFYILWLGSRFLLQAVREKPLAQTMANADETGAQRLRHSWVRGFSTNLLNPKIGVFYVAVMPQFIPTRASHLAVGLLLACVHDAEGLFWFSALIVLAHSARRALSRRRTQRVVDGITGSALIGFELNLGLWRR